MRIGFVSFWFTRGQAFVTREIRRIYREAGHETFVLARPDKLKGRVRTDGIWDEEEVEVASTWAIPAEELIAWAAKHEIEVCFFFQNDHFDSIAALRATGVTTVGTFMWEMLPAESAPDVSRAFDCVYSMHAAQTRHFATMGLLTPRVHWGCWPEIREREVPERDPDGPVTFYYPAGYLEIRRVILPTVKAFIAADVPHARLLVKSTKPVPKKDRVEHPGVIYHADDVERDEYLDLLASCHVCLSNTRWEGLGLVLYEAIAMGLPVICPDFPPMNEVVRPGLTGLLVACSTRRKAPSGIPAADVKPRHLTAAIRRLSDRSVIARMSKNTRVLRDVDLAWDRTRSDYLLLLDHVAATRGK